MFRTINIATLQTLEEDKKPFNIQVPLLRKPSRFYGACARSTTGCLCCRIKKKKCDEVHPTCGLCTRKGQICTWATTSKKGERSKGNRKGISLNPICSSTSVETDSKNNQVEESIRRQSSSSNEPDSDIHNIPFSSPQEPNSNFQRDNADFSEINDLDLDLDFGGAVVEDILGFKEDLALFQMELEEQRPDSQERQIDNPQKETLSGQFSRDLGYSSVVELDAEGIIFFEYYRTTYCNFVSIGLKLLNYFNKTFLWLASLSPGVAYAVTAWGGFYLELKKPKCDFTRPWTYMQKAAKAMYEEMGSDLKPSSKKQLLALFAFYLIFIGIEVCTGDIRNWRGLMKQCTEIINTNGGPKSLSDTFEGSNDIKWLLSNFCFHDILSSHALTDGTTFPMSEYEAVVSPNFAYGIDPLHGIVSPAYLIFGHIGNSKAELNQQWDEVKRRLEMNHPDAERLREQYYEDVERITDEINQKIDLCQPSATHVELLKDDSTNQELHMGLFELYVYACKIQLNTSIQKLPQCALVQQQLLLKSFKLLDILLVTQVKVALSLLILLCGILCCTDRDRARMTALFRIHLNQYEIGNLQRIEETVLEAWDLCPDGRMCLDWSDLVRDKNWHLYVG